MSKAPAVPPIEALAGWLRYLTPDARNYRRISRREFLVVVVFRRVVDRDRIEHEIAEHVDQSIELLCITEGTAMLGYRIYALLWWGPKWSSPWVNALRCRCAANMMQPEPEIAIGPKS